MTVDCKKDTSGEPGQLLGFPLMWVGREKGREERGYSTD